MITSDDVIMLFILPPLIYLFAAIIFIAPRERRRLRGINYAKRVKRGRHADRN